MLMLGFCFCFIQHKGEFLVTGQRFFCLQASQRDEGIEGQKEHHKKRTFQEEFVDFLAKQGIEFNEKYLWS